MNSPCGNAILELDSGLFLEDRCLLLPWGARRHHLLQDCHPDEVNIGRVYDEFVWHRAITLGGLLVPALQVILYPYGWLDSVWLRLECGACPRKAGRAFQDAQSHLARVFGPPAPGSDTSSLYPATSLEAPTCEPSSEQFLNWQQRTTHIALLLQPAEQLYDDPYSCMLHIAHRD